MGREFELKYRSDEETIAAIWDKFRDFTKISMETSYYDNINGDFSQLHWTLRRRWENGMGVCTLKIPLADGSRGEWEVRCEDIRTAIPELCKLGAPEDLLTLSAGPLNLRCGARFTRLAKTITIPGAVLELALDQGVLLGGGREEAFCEVECELKEGSEEAVTAFAQSLAEEFALEPQPDSKQKRAMALAPSHT